MRSRMGRWKKRAPILRAKRAERRRRRKTDPFLSGPVKPRKDGFTVHGAKRRMLTDEAFEKEVMALPPETFAPKTTTRVRGVAQERSAPRLEHDAGKEGRGMSEVQTFRGRVVLETVRKGTASEHEAAVLLTEYGYRLVLVRLGSNPFKRNDAWYLTGKSAVVDGYRLGGDLRYLSIRESG